MAKASHDDPEGALGKRASSEPQFFDAITFLNQNIVLSCRNCQKCNCRESGGSKAEDQGKATARNAFKSLPHTTRGASRDTGPVFYLDSS
jgi:hypothetical protein